jgi:hypothetical protein
MRDSISFQQNYYGQLTIHTEDDLDGFRCHLNPNDPDDRSKHSFFFTRPRLIV